MDAARREKIAKKAQEVTSISENFQLIHATYACQTIIKEIVIRYFNDKCEELRKRIEEKIKHNCNYDEEIKEKKRLQSLIQQSNFHIDVTYIETATEDTARVVKIENAFVINLSRKLEQRIFNKDGTYNYEVIKKIRKLMAHELGHLILHTNELLNIDGTQGSKDISDEEEEKEADFFGKEIIRLRKLRNKKIYEDGGAHKMY